MGSGKRGWGRVSKEGAVRSHHKEIFSRQTSTVTGRESYRRVRPSGRVDEFQSRVRRVKDTIPRKDTELVETTGGREKED